MVDNHYRWDFIGLSTDTKPTPETSEKVTNGSTFYCSDNSKLYVWYKNQWYEKVVEGGGGGGGDINVVQTTGDSTTDVMSQDATTKMVYPDPSRTTQIGIGNSLTMPTSSSRNAIAIGATPTASGANSIAIGTLSKASGSETIAIGRSSRAEVASSIAIGYNASAYNGTNNVAIGQGAGSYSSSSTNSVAIGGGARANHANTVAIGVGSLAEVKGQFDIGASGTNGYSNSAYRLLTGLYDGQSAHDAVTVEQVNATIDAINTALSTSIPHIGA